MKASKILLFAGVLIASVSGLGADEAVYDVLESRYISEEPSLGSVEEGLFSRALLDEQTLERLLIQLNQSGTIMDVLNEVADSRQRQDNLVSLAVGVINGNTSILSNLDINISLNTSSLLEAVKASGLIPSTAKQLLYDDYNLHKLTDFVGSAMSKNAWIAQLLYDMNSGTKLTVDHIADLIKNTKTKNPNYLYLNDQKSDQVYLSIRDDSTDGSASEFFNNILGELIQSNIGQGTVEEFMVALNRSNIVVPTLMQIIDDQKLLNATSYMISQLYDKGAFDKLDLPALIQKSKDEHTISDGLNFIFTSPVYEPGVANFLNILKTDGVFQNLKLNLYGP